MDTHIPNQLPPMALPTQRDWPKDASTALSRLLGLASGTAPHPEIFNCASLIRIALNERVSPASDGFSLIDIAECQASNRQAWGICNAVALALGDDLDHDKGSAASITVLKDRIVELEQALRCKCNAS